MELGKCYKPGLFPPSEPVLNIYQHTTGRIPLSPSAFSTRLSLSSGDSQAEK